MKHRKLPYFFLILPLLGILTANAQTPEQPGHLLLAADVFDLNLDVATTLDIDGETNFFSSRHNRYAGGRIMIHNKRQGSQPDDTFYTGLFIGLMWGKSSFLLNWEEPGLQSFDPLDSTFTTFAFPIGFDFNLRLGGFLTLSPYVSTKFMTIKLNVEILDEDYGDTALKMGFDAGLKVAIKLGGIRLAGGAGLTHIMGEEIEFELDDLPFKSKTGGSSTEYFLGVEL